MMLASEDVRPGILLRTVWGPPAQGRPEKFIGEIDYAGGLRFEFKKEDGFDPKTAYAGMRVADGFAASWRDDMTLVLEGTARVPFAVAGIKI